MDKVYILYFLLTAVDDGDQIIDNLLENMDLWNHFLKITPGISYIVDETLVIRAYSKESWNEFARENNGNNLLAEKDVLNKSILGFINGQEVKNQYNKLYEKILHGEIDEIKIASNCDSPAVLRDNLVYLRPIKDLENQIIGIYHQSLIVNTKDRSFVRILEDQTSISKSGKKLFICSICKFINPIAISGISRWIPIRDLDDIHEIEEIMLDHSICPDCKTKLDVFL